MERKLPYSIERFDLIQYVRAKGVPVKDKTVVFDKIERYSSMGLDQRSIAQITGASLDTVIHSMAVSNFRKVDTKKPDPFKIGGASPSQAEARKAFAMLESIGPSSSLIPSFDIPSRRVLDVVPARPAIILDEARPVVRISVGEEEPRTLGLIELSTSLDLDGVPLTKGEWKQLLASETGVFLRGRWLKLERDQIARTLLHWRAVESTIPNFALSFTESMRLLAGLRLRVPDLQEEEGTLVVAGRWLARALDGLRDPEGLADVFLGSALKAELRPYQRVGVRWLHLLDRLGLGACLADDMGLGKELPVDTEVATPNGWRRIGDLRVGDLVIGSDGKPTRVEGVYPQGVKSSYRLTFSDDSSVEAGAEHLWTMRYRAGGRRWQDVTLTTEQLMKREPIKLNWQGKSRHGTLRNYSTVMKTADVRFYLPMLTGPVEFVERDLPIPAYALGQLIANGGLNAGSARLFTNVKDWNEVLNRLEKDGVDLGPVNARHSSTARVTLLGKIAAIRELDLAVLSKEKRIPRIYLEASIEKRTALFHGLMDADGTISEDRNKIAYCSTSSGLAKDVVELVETLGGIASVNTYDRSDEGKPTEYIVRIRVPEWLPPFTVSRKLDRYKPGSKSAPCRVLERIEYVRDVESVCISVDAPDQLYVTEHCILTHNTLQVIAMLLAARREAASKNLLVVPASLIGNWNAELTKFAPSLKVFTAHPSAMTAGTFAALDKNSFKGMDVVITSYSFVQKLELLRETEWRTVILDEAQAIKNPDTKQAKAAKALKSRTKLALTGTPVENRLEDLWSIFDFISPGLLGTNTLFSDFIKDLEEAQDYEPLRNLVRPYILRRLKSDKKIIADLPDKTEMLAYCGLTEVQAKLYQTAVNDLSNTLKNVKGMERRGMILAYLTRFKQICNHPSQFLNDGDYAPNESGKFIRLRGIVEDVASRKEKLLVFTQFRQITEPLADYLETVFEERGLVLHGGTPVSKRQDMVNAFQADDGPPFFVLSIKAGGTGLNLTAASHVVHFDRWWNPAVENQATDRAYRIGQKRNVLVHKFVCRGTIEDKIDAMIESKKALSSEVLGGDGSAILTELSDAELLKMVSLDIHIAMTE